ncbi:MAG TPA: FMN-binding protein [Haloplasmataceae bacterium]
MKKFLSLFTVLVIALIISACGNENKNNPKEDELDNITETFDSYTFGTFVVVNGTIVLADFNAAENAYEYLIDENGKFVKDNGKNIILVQEKDGDIVPLQKFVTKDSAKEWYGMSQIGKTEWYKQVQAVEKYLLEKQELKLNVTYNQNNEEVYSIDGVSQATMSSTNKSLKDIFDKLSTVEPTNNHPYLTNVTPGPKNNSINKQDGYYFAAADTFDGGYRYYTIVKIENGIITNVVWNGYHIDGGESKCLGDDKYTCAAKGNYGMAARATKGEWHVQAAATAKWIVETQNINPTFNGEKVDAITSATITVKELFDLINTALQGDPVPQGTYTDGFYYIETTKTPKTVEYARQLVEE